MILAVPVDPDAEEARELLVRELAKPVYRAAEPTWFDRLSATVGDWLADLLESGPGGTPAIAWTVIILALVAAIVAAYLIFGPPRVNRRSTVVGGLFGDDDSRSAQTLHAAADRAAAAGDWVIAIEEMFRAIARMLSERAIVSTMPGTTASTFAASASGPFPESSAELASAAASFDPVRYLDRPGSRTEFDALAALERNLRSSTPHFAGAGA
ncbi:MAG: DUF4129 domain-containing protein [Microbacteriaceae bacterium]|nr:DUF4129 domain-containing protein [Microbacteriaceae bacterium]